MNNNCLKCNKIILLSLFLCLANISIAKAKWELPDNPGLPTNFDTGVTRITDWLLGFVVSLSLLAIIWGGLRYIGSSGSQDQAQGAKKTIQYAIMGLAIAGLAYAFVHTIATQVLI